MAKEMMTAGRPARNLNPAPTWEAAEREFREASEALERDPSDQTVDRYVDARRAMLATPSSSQSALAVKLEELLAVDEGEEFGTAWAETHLTQTRADIERLLGAPFGPPQPASSDGGN